MTPPNNSQSKKEAQDKSAKAWAEIQPALDYLLDVANRHNVCVAGFVWGKDPLIISNFGNTGDQAKEIELYANLVSLCKRQRDAGRVQYIKHQKPN